MNSKKAITLLVLATMLLALVPVFPVHAALQQPTILPATGEVGDTIEVTGGASEVPAGYAVEVYWDDVTKSWNGEVGKMNSTTSKKSGSYEVWFDVPEAPRGTHYVWVKVPTTGETDSDEFLVTESMELSSSSGLAGEEVYVDVYGMDEEEDYKVYFVPDAGGNPGWTLVVTGPEAVGAAGSTHYEGTTAVKPILPGTVAIAGGAVPVDDTDAAGNSYGVLYAGATAIGTIDYLTGEYEIDFANPTANPVTITYSQVTDASLKSSTSNALGTKKGLKVTIPIGSAVGDYHFAAISAKGANPSAEFAIGAVIELGVTKGDSGDLIRVKGRGFNVKPLGGTSDILTIEILDDAGAAIGAGLFAQIIDDETNINAAGEFDIQIVMPDPGDDGDFRIEITDDNQGAGAGGKSAWAEFEVVNNAEITLNPEYGPQGSTVTITGKHFPNINGETVRIQFVDGGVVVAPNPVKELETKSDGSFSGTFRVPTQPDKLYTVRVAALTDAAAPYGIQVEEDFRVGTILVLLSDEEGPAGMEVTLTGSGFTEGPAAGTGKWNATFGGEELFATVDTTATGLLDNGGTPVFYVPQMDPGVYDIVVLDVEAEIEIVVEFTITETTGVELDPATLPSGYNMTINGMNWADDPAGTFTFTLYNDTEEWDISPMVLQHNPGVQLTVTDEGDFEAWWLAEQPTGEELDKGVYWLNITDSNDYFVQTSFTIGDEHISAAPRKSTFRVGDTVSFNIQHSFGNVAPVTGGDIRVFDPSGSLYWDGDALNTWTKVGMYYVAPASSQTAALNPMVLLDDAPLGTWTYEWREAGANPDTIKEGTFEVAAAEADVISDQVTDLNNQITDLASQLSDVTAEFSDVKSDIADVAAIAQQAVTAAQQAAEAVQTVAQTANTASQAASDAAEAANAARDAANGLTTLVYGAIGAALVAALAAIVSLMQISRRIAG